MAKPEQLNSVDSHVDAPQPAPVAPPNPEDVATREAAAARIEAAQKAGDAEAQQGAEIAVAQLDQPSTPALTEQPVAETPKPADSSTGPSSSIREAVNGFKDFAVGLIDSFRSMFRDFTPGLLKGVAEEIRSQGSIGLISKLQLRMTLALGGAVPSDALGLADPERKLLESSGFSFKPEQINGKETGKIIVVFEGTENIAERARMVFEGKIKDAFRAVDDGSFSDFLIHFDSNVGALKSGVAELPFGAQVAAEGFLSFLREKGATDDVNVQEFLAAHVDELAPWIQTAPATPPAQSEPAAEPTPEAPSVPQAPATPNAPNAAPATPESPSSPQA